MLKISSEQLEKLNETTTLAFHRRLMKFLREELCEVTSSMDDNALRKRIIEGERRALKYDIESEAGIAQFVCLTFVGDPKFDELPEVQNYLQKSDLSSEEKLDELINYLDALEDDPNTKPSDVLLTPEE